MASAITMIEQNPALKKSGSISIQPYFDPEKENMGLEKYRMSLYDGVFHEEQLACIEQNGVMRYITGLNEYAPEVKMIADPKEREAKAKEIRVAVSELEKELASNVIDPKDPEFWNKVKLLRPDNTMFWNKITIRCGNKPVYLDPVKDPYDRIKLYAIEAGGFVIIAKSLEIARSMPVPPKFYLDKVSETAHIKTELKKQRNTALAMLQDIYEKNPVKLMYVAKVTDGNSAQYRKSTPIDIVYDNMDRFINGDGIEKNKLRAARTFISNSDLDMETLKLRCIVKDAVYHRELVTKSDGHIYHTGTSTMLGRNVSDIVEFLKNPINEEVLGILTTSMEKHWNQ